MARGFGDVVQAATVFVDGVNLLGVADSLTLPNVQAKMADHRPMGFPSDVKRFHGFEPIVFEMVLNEYNPAALKEVGNPDVRAYNYQVRWSTRNNNGDVKYGVSEISGTISGAERAAFEDGEEPPTTTFTVEAVAYKETFDGETIYDIDAENGKFEVGGVDHWSDILSGIQ